MSTDRSKRYPRFMAEKKPTQKTPRGLEIPVPKRKDLMDAFRKIIKPVKKD